MPNPVTSGLVLALQTDAGAFKDSGLATPCSLDGDAFGGWQDQSGLSNNFTQATTANQGTYKLNIFGTKPGLLTSGATGSSAQHLDLANGSASAGLLAAQTGSGTVFFVINPVGLTATYHPWFSKNLEADARFFFLAVKDAAGYHLQRYNSIHAAPSIGGVGSVVNTAQTYVLGHTFDSTANVETWRVNGQQISRRTGSIAAADTTTAFRVGCSGAGSPTISYNGYVGHILIYNRVLSATECEQVESYLATWASASLTTVDNTVRFVCEGDSLTYGSHSTNNTNGYPVQLLSLLGKNYGCVNWGVPSQTLATMVSNQAVKTTPGVLPASQSVLFLWAGHNDLIAGTAAATIESNYQTYCTNARAAGYKVIAFTIFVGTDISGANETNRQTFNTWLRANWNTFADGLADLDADSRLQNFNNTTYFYTDKVHLVDAGYGVVASIVQGALSGLSLPSTGYTISGPSSGQPGQASTNFTVTLETGKSASGDQTITLAPSDGTITATATGTITGNGTNNVSVTPASGQTSFTFTYTPASGGNKTITPTNNWGWTDPSASTYTAAAGGGGLPPSPNMMGIGIGIGMGF